MPSSICQRSYLHFMGTACCKNDDLQIEKKGLEACAEEKFTVDMSDCQLELAAQEVGHRSAGSAPKVIEEVTTAENQTVVQADDSDTGYFPERDATETEPQAEVPMIPRKEPTWELFDEDFKESTIGQEDFVQLIVPLEKVPEEVADKDAPDLTPKEDRQVEDVQNVEGEQPAAKAAQAPDAKRVAAKKAAAKKKKEAEEAKRKAAAEKKKADEAAKQKNEEEDAKQKAMADDESQKREGQVKARARKKAWKAVDQARQNSMIAKLCEAATKGDIPVLMELLGESVDVDVFGPKGDYMTPLHCACEAGQTDFVKALVIHAGADILGNIKVGANTPLHLAAMNNHAECCEIVGGPRALTMKNGQGKTPKDLAEDAGAKAALRVLKKLAKKV